jgi:integrase
VLSGFGLKVTPTGKRIYIVQYRPKGQSRIIRRYTLGRHGDPWRTEAARTAAEDLLARVRLGEDPFETDRRRRESEAAAILAEKEKKERERQERFADIAELFIEKYAKPRNRRWSEPQRIFRSRDLKPWRDRPISSITKRDIIMLIDGISERSTASARMAFANLRKLFSWCVERLYLEASPFQGLRGPPPSRARDRVLNDSELKLVWQFSYSASDPFGPLFRLLILTGQRRDEVTSMRWSEVDLETAEWTIPAERAKNGKSHVVDLAPLALAELKALRLRTDEARKAAGPRTKGLDFELVFSTTWSTPVSGHGKVRAAIDEGIALQRRKADRGLKADQATLPAWRLHDLRRTAATGMARLGFPPHVVEAVLNHRSGARGGLIAVYQHYDHRSERREALHRWDGHVAGLIQAVLPEQGGQRAA